MSDWILDVSSLNEYVSQALMADPVLRSIRLRGEVSNFKSYPSGHWYFTLKDERCKISCVMFRTNAMRMSFRPREGEQVIMHGNVRLYEEGGTYQFVADSMRPEGIGSLYQQFERLKAKLQAEGLFDEDRKRFLPARPRKIAVVTSEAGAVLHDIRRIAAKRDAGVPLVLLPVQVQGDGAALQIAQAIRKAGTLKLVDVIITGRGGGSIEDLWAFNEECVARAIADSPVPVISAVGHETDFTIADFVADVRASTPSNAAELAVPERSELVAALRAMRRRFDAVMRSSVSEAELRIARVRRELDRNSPEKQLKETEAALYRLRTRLDSALDQRMAGYAPRIAMAQVRLDHEMDQCLASYSQMVKQNAMHLEAVSPQRVLEHGYVLVTDRESHVLTSARHTAEKMTLHFHDGMVRVQREEE